MVRLSMFLLCLKATIKKNLELNFEYKSFFAMQRFTAENPFLTRALQVY